MGQRILVGVPTGCPPHIKVRFEELLRGVTGTVEYVEFVDNVDNFFTAMIGAKIPYDISVLFDELGEKTQYVPFLEGFKHRFSEMKTIIVVPDGRKGTMPMSELLRKGQYNALFQKDLTVGNIRELLFAGRDREKAANYYEVPLTGGDGSTDIVTYGSNLEGKESRVVVRKLKNGVTVTRMYSQDAKRVDENATSDEDNFSYLDTEHMGMDRVSNSKMPLYEFPLEADYIEKYREKLNAYYRREGLMDFQAYDNGKMTDEEFEFGVKKQMAKFPLTLEEKNNVMESFIRSTKSYGKLDVILNTKDVSDIRLINKDNVNVQIKGIWYRTNISFRTDDEYEFFVRRLCTKNKMSLNQVQAQIIFSDIDTNENVRLRFAVTSGMLNTNRLSSAHIRTISKIKKLFDVLIKEGMLTAKQAGFLINAIRNKKSMILCGGSGSGKTVLLNGLIEYTDDNICGACVQEAEELFSDTKNNLEFTHSISNKGEGKVEHTLAEIATQALLKNASLFIIGEIKGKEARDFFTAANTGAQCLCTTHALSVFEALPRIADLAKYAGDYSQEDLLKMLSRGIDVIVHMDHYKVVSIASVVGWDEEVKDVQYDVYDFGE